MPIASSERACARHADAWFAPNLTGSARDGLGAWSARDIVEYLKTGANPHAASAGPMTEVVMNSTRHLTDADLATMAAYLKDLPARRADGESDLHDAPVDALTRDKAVYVDQCMGCHMADGKGQADAFPPLAGASAVQAADPRSLIHVVLAGDYMADPPARPAGLAMPAFNWKLSDRQVADVLDYVRNSWGNRAPSVEVDDVAQVRQAVREYGPRYQRMISHDFH